MRPQGIHNFSVGDLVRVPVLGIHDGLFKIVKFETVPHSHHPIAVVAYVSGSRPPGIYKRTRVALFRLESVSPLEQLAAQADNNQSAIDKE